MRNLKRALSLALASVMLVGMMVVGSSAASYPDVEDTDHVEAIEVLSAVGVIVGDNGNFRPDDSVSRNEMAVIMAKLILGTYEADSYVGSHPFTDVPSWASRYVAACYNSGIISGRGEGIYDGNSTVTAVEAAAMMLRALGYQDLSKGASQWDQPVAAKANEINLFKGLGGNSQTPMDRDSVAQLALNTLQADVVITEKEGDIEIPGTIVIPGKITYKAVQSSDPYASAIDGIYGTDNNNNVQLGEKLYKGDLEKKTNSNDDFERPATEWTYKGREVIKAVNSADATYTKAVKLGDIYKDLGLGKAVDKDSVDFYLNGKPESETKGGKITANNKVGSEAAAPTLDTLNLVKGEEHKIGGNGVLTQVWYNAKTNTATITMIETYVGKVNTVVKSTGSAARYVKVGSTTSYGSLTTLNNKFETESFETDDLVIFTAAYNGSKYDIKSMEALELSATEVLTRWEGSSVVNSDKGNANSNFTAGETYDYSKNNLVVDEDGAVLANGIADFKVNESEINVYVDKYGYAIYVSGVEGEKNYAAVIGMGSSNTHGSETRGVTLLLADGTQKTVTAKSDYWNEMTLIDHSSATYQTSDLDTVGNSSSANDKNLVDDGVADVVTYSIGSDGVYKLTLVGERKKQDGANAAQTVYSGKYDMAADSRSSGGNVTFVNGKSEIKLTSDYDGTISGTTVTAGSKTYYTTSKTIFMVATQKKTTNMTTDAYKGRNYNVYVGYENAPSFITASDAIHGIAFALNKQYTNQIDVVYIDAEKMAGVSGADTYFVKDGSDIITTSDGKYYELPAVIDGELTTILIDAEVKASWNGTPDTKLEDAEKGVYAIENIIKNNKDIIESCDLVAFNVKGAGTVRDRDTVLGIGTSITSAVYWAYNSDTKVYYVDSDWNLDEVGMSGIQTDENDLVYAMYDDDSTKAKKLTYVFVKEVEAGESSDPGGNNTKPSGDDKIPVTVIAKLDDVGSAVTFLTQGNRSATVIEKKAAVLAAYVKAGHGYDASDLEVKVKKNDADPSKTEYTVKIKGDEMELDTYTETASTGEIKVPAVVPPAAIWEDVENDPSMETNKAPNGQSYRESYQQLVNSPAFSKNVKTEIVEGTGSNAGKYILKITGIEWMSVDTYVPCFGGDQSPAKTVKEAYCTTGGNTPTLGDKLGNATQFAIVSLTDKDGGTRVLIIGNGSKAPGTDNSDFDWLDPKMIIDWGTIPSIS